MQSSGTDLFQSSTNIAKDTSLRTLIEPRMRSGALDLSHLCKAKDANRQRIFGGRYAYTHNLNTAAEAKLSEITTSENENLLNDNGVRVERRCEAIESRTEREGRGCEAGRIKLSARSVFFTVRFFGAIIMADDASTVVRFRLGSRKDFVSPIWRLILPTYYE
jgi:hypothetical protein